MTNPDSLRPSLPARWPDVAAAIDLPRLMADFEALCDFGGRFAGTDSERAAVGWLKATLAADLGREPGVVTLAHDGWQRRGQRLELLDGAGVAGVELACHALVWSPSTPAGGLEAEVVDLGRGTLEEIAGRAAELRGRIALVRHEYMFWPGTVHRRVKYDAAKAAGAAGFLIANRVAGDHLVTGSSGRNGPEDVPAAGITLEGAAALTATGVPHPRVRLTVDTTAVPTVAECLVVDLPGRGHEWVVLSAHIDGHPLAESAMDNATGLAAVLAIGRAMAPMAGSLERGLRICLFNLEEWGVAGSARYLDEMAPEGRAAIALNVNLDAIAGDPALTALTSEFPRLEPFLAGIAGALNVPLGLYAPLMRNSDHHHFARHGIPALRLVSGFNKPGSELRWVLTPEDRRDKVDPSDLAAATRLAAAITFAACSAPMLDLRGP